MNTATIIANEVSRVTRVPVNEILSGRRSADIVTARHMCIVLMREFTSWSTPTIARSLNMLDHTSVGHALRQWPTRLRRQPMAEHIGKVRLRIAERLADQRAARRAHAEANGHVVA